MEARSLYAAPGPTHVGPMPEEQSFWEELKKRRVVRVAVVYAAVGWAVFEGSISLTEAFALPEFTPRLVLGLLILGFPVALALTWALQVTPQGIQKERPFAPEGTSSRLPFLAGLTVGLLAVGGLALVFTFSSDTVAPGGTSEDRSDSERVAVIPFTVSAQGDLSWLAVGFQELLHSRLADGELGPRSIHPGTVNDPREPGGPADPRGVAERLGARFVVTGSAVGDTSHVVVEVIMEDLETSDRTVARAEGSPSSPGSLADDLVAQLVGLSQGEYPESVPHLLSMPFQAQRAYYQGKEAWREGRWYDAADLLARAMEEDTTFALAGLARADVQNMAIFADSAENRRGRELARRHRDRLSRRDRIYLDVRFPEEPRTWAETLSAYETLTNELPDRVEAFYFWGEVRLHNRNDGAPEWPRQARRAFAVALELNPGYFSALEHLVLAGLYDLEADSLQTLAARYRVFNNNPVYDGLLAGTGRLELDSAALARPGVDVNWVWMAPIAPIMWPDRAPEDLTRSMDAALGLLRSRIGTAPNLTREAVTWKEYDGHVALGRPVRAQEAFPADAPPSDREILELAAWDRTFLEMAEDAARAIEDRTPGSGALDIDEARDLFALEVRKYAADTEYTGMDVARRIRRAAEDEQHPLDLELEARALLLEAWHQARTGDGAVDAGLDRLDELIAEGPEDLEGAPRSFLLAVAEVHEELGDPARALSTLERRSYVPVVGHEVEILRRMGMYAAAVGDTARALQEYRRYLTLRADPESSVVPEVEAVRAEVAGLEGGGGA